MTGEPRRRVGLDGFNLAIARGTGVATYARNLSAALRGMGREIDVLYGLNVPPRAPRQLRETLFFSELGEGRSGDEPPKARAWSWLPPSPWPQELVETPVTGRVIRSALAARLPAFDRLFTRPSLFHAAARHFRSYGRFMTVRVPDPPAVMHWTYPLPLRLEGARNLYTLHDLVPLRLPFTSLDNRRDYHRLIRTCLATADHICTVSETSRQDIIDLFGADPVRVTNTYQAVSAPDPESSGDPVRLAHRLRTLFGLEPGGYFLFFGAIEPKKNVGRLIEAYLLADVATPLVLAGPRAWKADAELRLLEGGDAGALKGLGRIRRLDYLPADYLGSLVRGARAVLFPSLYEGFGLPMLEAMAGGVPVMAGAGGALPEVAGEAALLVNPYDVQAMAQAIRRLDSDAGLRAGLAAAGALRAQAFSMAAYQSRLGDLHEQVLAGPASARRPHRSWLPTSLSGAPT